MCYYHKEFKFEWGYRSNEKVVVLDAHSVNPGEFDWNIFLDCVDEVERYDRTSEDEILRESKMQLMFYLQSAFEK